MKNKEKEVVLNETKKSKKEGEKLFTKKKSKVTIKKNYNPFDKDYNSIYERGGLYMEETKVTLKRLTKKSNWKDKIFVKIFPKICIKLYRKGMADCFNYYNKNGTF